jgi:hypothetical protein
VTRFEKTIARAAVGATPLAEERTEEATRPVTRSAVTAGFDAAGTVAETLSGVQIRHGPDGRWYPFTRHPMAGTDSPRGPRSTPGLR